MNKTSEKRMRWHEISKELGNLIKAGHVNPHFVEVGVWKAQNARAVLEMVPTACATLVDPWSDHPTGSSYVASGDRKATLSQDKFELAMNEAIANLSGLVGRFEIIRGCGKAASEGIKPASLVFLDGDHSYDGVYSDLEVWYDALLPGGVMGGHDWDHPKFPGFGVDKAVHSFLKSKKIVTKIRLGADRTWFFTKPKGV